MSVPPQPASPGCAANLPLGEGIPDGPTSVTHLPEVVIHHEPIVEKEELQETTVETCHEHHIQPVIHATEHRIQPIIQTQVDVETPITARDANVMERPIVEPVRPLLGLEPVESLSPDGSVVKHVPRVEREVVQEHCVEMVKEHHIQPIIHEVERQVQPIIRTNITCERPLIENDREVLHEPLEERIGEPIAELTEVANVVPEAGIVEHVPKIIQHTDVEERVQINHEHRVRTVYVERVRQVRPVVRYEVVGIQDRVIGEKEEVVTLPPTILPATTRAPTGEPLWRPARTGTKPLPPLPSTTRLQTATPVQIPVQPSPVMEDLSQLPLSSPDEENSAMPQTSGGEPSATRSTAEVADKHVRGRRGSIGQKLKVAVHQLPKPKNIRVRLPAIPVLRQLSNKAKQANDEEEGFRESNAPV